MTNYTYLRYDEWFKKYSQVPEIRSKLNKDANLFSLYTTDITKEAKNI